MDGGTSSLGETCLANATSLTTKHHLRLLFPPVWRREDLMSEVEQHPDVAF